MTRAESLQQARERSLHAKGSTAVDVPLFSAVVKSPAGKEHRVIRAEKFLYRAGCLELYAYYDTELGLSYEEKLEIENADRPPRRPKREARI